MKKVFIRDEGKIRNCVMNTSKMNILEWMWYRKSLILEDFINVLKEIGKGLIQVGVGIICLIIIILFPITFPIAGYMNIKSAKIEVERLKKYRPHLFKEE